MARVGEALVVFGLLLRGERQRILEFAETMTPSVEDGEYRK
jgi:hypothetical protein